MAYGISSGNFFAKITFQKCIAVQSAAVKVDTTDTANGGLVLNVKAVMIDETATRQNTPHRY